MSSASQSPAPRQLAGMAEEGGDGDEKTIVVGALDAEEETVAGADEAEEEMDGGGGGGNGLFLPPPGFRFAPTEDEMIRYYLLPKLQGRAYVPNNAIIEDSVDQCHPDGLTRKYMDRGQGRSWYFLSPRERKYKNGDRPRRDTKDLRGRWKASTGKREEGGGGDDDDDDVKEKVAGDGTTKYWRSALAYFYFQGRRAKEKKSGWLMTELTIPEYEIKLPKEGGPGGPTLDRYVMYKIYPAPKNKGKDDDEAGPSNAAEQVESDDEGQMAELPPMQLCNPAAAKKKRARRSNRLQIEPPAPPPPPPPPPSQGNGMQAPFRMPGYCDGSGHPMGYHQAGVPMPLPLVPYNNGQVHVPLQQVAYNGQVPIMTPQPAPYNGQMPVTQQQGAYNCQVPMMTRQPAPYNGQMPLTQQYRPVGAPNNHGQNQAMMTRPSCPAGQAVNPPPVVPQTQKQPETDEMLEKRVLQQNLEEYLWMQQQELEMALMMHEQQQWTMVLMMHQEQQQQYYQNQPYPGASDDYDHHAGGNAPQFSLDDFYASVAAEHYMRSRAVPPVTSGSPGEAAPVNADGSPVSTVVSAGGSGDSNNGNNDRVGGSGNSNNGNHDRAESAAVKASPGGSGSASAEGGMAPNPDMVRPSDRCPVL